MSLRQSFRKHELRQAALDLSACITLPRRHISWVLRYACPCQCPERHSHALRGSANPSFRSRSTILLPSIPLQLPFTYGAERQSSGLQYRKDAREVREQSTFSVPMTIVLTARALSSSNRPVCLPEVPQTSCISGSNLYINLPKHTKPVPCSLRLRRPVFLTFIDIILAFRSFIVSSALLGRKSK